MADGRMLKKKISYDEQVAQLSDRAKLLYTWAVAHADVAGRIEGSARSVKASVVPLEPWSVEEIDAYIGEWEKTVADDGTPKPLVRRYRADGKSVIEFAGFLKNQTIRPDREAASTLPPAPGELPANSRSAPGKEVSKEGRKKTSSEGSSPNGDSPSSDKRAQNEVWDVLVEIFGEPATRSERGRRNAAWKELRDAGASADDVRLRASAYRQRWPEIEMTPNALASNWTSLGNGNGRAAVAVNAEKVKADRMRRRIEEAGR